MKELSEQQLKAVQEQNIAFDAILSEIEKGTKILKIAGVGGTGKTQLASRLAHEIAKGFITSPDSSFPTTVRIAGAAISHNAKNILQSRFREAGEHSTEFFTIASFLKLKRKISNTGVVTFEPPTDYTGVVIPASTYDLIIIDECSQIDKETMNNLAKFKKPSALLIYLGDWHQTSPIVTDKVVKGNKDSDTFKYPGVSLFTPFRYEGGLAVLASAIEKEIDSNAPNFGFLKEFFNTPDDSYVFEKDKKAFINKYIEATNENPDLRHAILINYRKNTAKDDNMVIRKLMGFPSKIPYTVGERLICRQGSGPSDSGSLVNQGLYKVVKAKPDNMKVVTKNGYYSTVKLESLALRDEGVLIPIMLLDVEDTSGNIITDIAVLLDEKNQHYITFKSQLNRKALAKREGKYWSMYYNFIETFHQFDNGYATNVHVVQGDTYNEVFVSLADILSINPISTREKLQAFYTAVTRARVKVHILI